MSRVEEIQAKRECHRCPYNGKGDPYCWQVCLGPSDKSNKGHSFVRLGAIEAQGEYLYSNADELLTEKAKTNDEVDEMDFSADESDAEADSAQETSADGNQERPEDFSGSYEHSVTESLDEKVERALVIILANMMSLSDTQLCIFRHVFHGEDLKKVGSTLPVPITKQAVFKHLLAMTRSNPVVEKVIHQMMRSGHGGAKRQTSQLDLFEAMGLDL